MLKNKKLIFTAAALIISQGAQAQDWGDLPKLQEFFQLNAPLTNRHRIESPVTNLLVMDSMGLKKAKLSFQPWSDTAWNDVRGSIATPYASGAFINPLGWSLFSRPAVVSRVEEHQKDFDTLSDEQLDQLSPSEKYDYLLGDKNLTLTNQVIKMVDQRAKMDLTASWTGVCHGWGPASLTLPRPENAFEITAANGRKLTFYPSDVKALASFLWGKSNAQASTKAEGWQCQTGAKTNKHGRLTDPRCFDVNPSFFHLTMVNLIGIDDRGFVMDRKYRGDVFNQPVFKYEYKFYNVTKKFGPTGITIDEARVPYSRKITDPFRPFRSPKIASLIGVETTVWYAQETSPDHKRTDGPSDDKIESYTMRYDLELDAQNNIVGGEWREFDDTSSKTLWDQVAYQHPDMVWMPSKKLKAFSKADPIEYWLGDGAPDAAFLARTANQPKWDGKGHPPKDWLEAQLNASIISAKNEVFENQRKDMLAPMPVSSIVDMLIARSREK